MTFPIFDGLPDRAQPTVQVKLVDAGELYVGWRWEHRLADTRAVVLPRAQVQPLLDELAMALPTPFAGESVAEALRRSLTNGPLRDPTTEIDLMTRLAQAVIPQELAGELNLVLAGGMRPHVRIQPSWSTGQVPWEALCVDVDGERFVDNGDLSVLPPATVRNAPERRVSPWRPDAPVVGVLDPALPGFGDASDLGSVLGPVPVDSPLRAMVAGWGDRAVTAPAGATDRSTVFRRRDVDRDALSAMLAGAGRLVYLGHVTTAEYGLDARLHLSCGPDTTGRAALVGPHRPLTAADLVLGHRPGTPGGWTMPNRVALIGCESGGEVRFAEPVGLVAAAIHSGAEYVTATRWTLPTDTGLRRFVPGAELAGALPDLVAAVDATHRSDAPVAALNAWQRDQAAAWHRTGAIEHSPVMWGALSTTYG